MCALEALENYTVVVYPRWRAGTSIERGRVVLQAETLDAVVILLAVACTVFVVHVGRC